MAKYSSPSEIEKCGLKRKGSVVHATPKRCTAPACMQRIGETQQRKANSASLEHRSKPWTMPLHSARLTKHCLELNVSGEFGAAGRRRVLTRYILNDLHERRTRCRGEYIVELNGEQTLVKKKKWSWRTQIQHSWRRDNAPRTSGTCTKLK